MVSLQLALSCPSPAPSLWERPGGCHRLPSASPSLWDGLGVFTACPLLALTFERAKGSSSIALLRPFHCHCLPSPSSSLWKRPGAHHRLLSPRPSLREEPWGCSHSPFLSPFLAALAIFTNLSVLVIFGHLFPSIYDYLQPFSAIFRQFWPLYRFWVLLHYFQ